MANTHITKNLFMVLLSVSAVLFIRWTAITDTIDDNLTTLANLTTWMSKDLSQIVCEDMIEPVTTDKATQSPQTQNVGHRMSTNLARKAYFSGDCESAFALWNLALERDSHDISAATMQYLSSGLNSEMLPVNVPPEKIAVFLYSLGKLADQNQNDNHAVFFYTKSFELQPTRAVADRLNSMLSNLGEKQYIWQKLAEDLTENEADHWWAIGHYRELMQEWDTALQAYSYGERLTSRPYNFLIKQGEIYTKLEAWDKAIMVYQQASSLRPQAITPYLEIGNSYREQRDFETAKSWYDIVVNQYPDNFAALYFLGVTHYELKEDIQARKHLSYALDLKPDHAASSYYLAQVLNRSGDSHVAVGYLERALASKEEKPWRWLMQLGDWRHIDGNVQGALTAYEEALELQPENITIQNKIKAIAGAKEK